MTHLFSLISKSDIRSEFGISKSTLDRWIKLHLWPKPMRIGGTALWRRSDIEDFLNQTAQGSTNAEVL